MNRDTRDLDHYHGPNDAQTCDICRSGEFANRRADIPRLSGGTAVALSVVAGLAAVAVIALVARLAIRPRPD